MKEKLKVPKLRFKEFSGEWEEKKLGNLLQEHTEKSKVDKEYPVLTSSLTKGLLPQTEYFENSRFENKENIGFNVIPPNYITYRSRSDNGNFIFNVNNLGYTGIISIYYPVFNINGGNNKFFIEFFNRNPYFFYNYAVGTSQKVLSFNIIKNTFVPYPSLPEQQKIADFLSKVDDKIEKLTKKKELLEQYKKGVMQKIFSQEIRFKDDNGNDFPEWEEKELNSLGNSYSGLSGKSGDDFGSGLPYITYKSIFDNIRIDLKKVGYVNVGDDESQTEVITGDIFFTTSSETPEEVGMSSVLLDEVNERCFLNSFCFGFRFNSFEETLPMFMGYYFRSKKMRDKITSLAQGSTRYNLPKTKFLKIFVNIPSLPEQQKIADFLSTLDKKIDIVNKELGQVQEFKKGLLQQMFV